ncbi:MAG: lytic transglycosylase domain-containing protein [Proteobacteria bacterium]|nr:lytic transglycosylase domain-containing protein [Pseudomonadota bacterium]
MFLLPSAQAAAQFETAALPRGDLTPDRSTVLPSPLSAADALLYRQIFQLQRRDEWTAADREISRLHDRQLLGYVLADRYVYSLTFRSTYGELAAWLSAYADHPDAPAIYRLAQRRAPKGAAPLRKPIGEAPAAIWEAEDLAPPLEPAPPTGRSIADEGYGRAIGIKGQVRAKLRGGDLAGAELLLYSRETARLLNAAEYDHLKATIAAGYFTHGQDRKALELASEAARRSGQVVPKANWIAGLALFRMEQFKRAAPFFEALAQTPNGQPWDIAAGAFWAARVHSRTRRFAIVNYWFGLAAEHPRTFYGLLASRALDKAPPFNWSAPVLAESDVARLMRTGAGARALALIQVGEEAKAEFELRRLYATGSPGLTRLLLAVAMRANMPGLSMKLGRELLDLDGRRHDGALYPIPRWRPIGGFEIDPALIFAFMRQESAFNPRAVSSAGARGLMQLMPATAALMDGKTFRGRADGLFDPEFNVTLGQRYIKHLLDNEIVQGDLIRLAAAYNGGPGNLARWQQKQDTRGETGDDALLFIESLPSPETRYFISRVLYNYWMYSLRLGQPTPSLDEVAAGKWPTYISDGYVKGLALDARN